MTNTKLILIAILSLISTSIIANTKQPITLIIPPAMANEMNSKNYKVPNLQTGREQLITSANATSATTQTASSTSNSVPASAPVTNAPIVHNPVKPISHIRHAKAKPFTPQQEQALRITEAYGDGSAIPSIGEAGRTVFIYGQKQPTIICAPFTVCMIELEKGETVLHHDIGDSVRWHVDPPTNGASYISLKPSYNNLQTNLVVITDKRTYTFKLQSTNNRYMSIVSFKYPNNDKEKWQAYHTLNNLKKKADEKSINTTKAVNNPNILQGKDLDYNYSYIGDAPFKPIRVWTDNIKTYIQLPKSVLSAELPVFQNISKSGSVKLVNQRYDAQKNIIEIDYKVEKGQLRLGQKKDKQIIEIVYTKSSHREITTIDNDKLFTER